MRVSHISALLAVVALAGCTPPRNEFAPPCPDAQLVRGLDRLVRYRTEGSRDLSDLVLEGQMIPLIGKCEWDDKKAGTVEVTTSLGAQFLRGPAMQGRQSKVPVVLAVMRNGDVLDEKRYDLDVEFPAGNERATVSVPEVKLRIPSSPTVSSGSFSMVAGFALTDTERAAGRGTRTR